MGPAFKIGARAIGPGHPTYIVAEVSGNHNQSFARAVEIVEAACKAGVDAIKLQTYTPDTLTIDCDKKWFRVAGTNEAWRGQTLYRLYRAAYTPWEWQPELKRAAERYGVQVFSTPFDATAVAFLRKMRVPAYKVASFELIDDELLRAIEAVAAGLRAGLRPELPEPGPGPCRRVPEPGPGRCRRVPVG